MYLCTEFVFHIQALKIILNYLDNLCLFQKVQKKQTRNFVISLCLSVCPSIRPSVCMCVCLPARMEQQGTHWTDFNYIWYLSFLNKNVPVKSKPAKIWQKEWVLCMKTYVHLWWHLTKSFRGIRNISDQICRENKNAYFMFNNLFPKIMPFMRNVTQGFCGFVIPSRHMSG
jgi:hypothetical protein